jgi:hypothetical protein
VTGAFPVADPPTDFLSFRTSNGGANKIDSFLERTIDYHVRADPTTGTADITAKVTLHNRAPSSGLPDYIIANNPGAPGVPTEPDGTNVLDFSLYGDGTLQSATRDGVALPVQAQLEFGHHVWSNRVSIPPGGQTTLEFHLTTTIEGGRYRLDVAGQPVARDDQLSVLVDVAPGWTVREASGWPPGTPRDARLGDGWTRVGTEQRTAQQGDVRFEVETSP